MTPIQSPHQIRRAAATAFRRRQRHGPSADEQPSTTRTPEGEETPLSASEVEFGVMRGLISPDATARAHAFAGVEA